MSDVGMRDPIYLDGIEDGRAEVLLVLQANLSTPGMSAGDVYAALATYCEALGIKVYDYDDPENPFALDPTEGGTCPECEAPIDAHRQFCADCGHDTLAIRELSEEEKDDNTLDVLEGSDNE